MAGPAEVASPDSVLPAIADLNYFKKGEHYLCINSAVPSWLVTNELGYMLLSLCDGRRSVRDIHSAFTGAGLNSSIDLLHSFFRRAIAQGIFIEPLPRDLAAGLAGNRADVRLSALHLHLTNKCNLSCTYCYRQSTPHLPIRHDAHEFIQVLQKLKPYATEDCLITFAGGEPLVFPGFAKVATSSKCLGFDNFLLTNGILLRRHEIRFYKDAFDDIRISLDGGDELTHSVTRGSGHFEKVISNIFWLVDGGVRPTVQMTLTKRNMTSAELLRERLPKDVYIRYTPMFPMGRADKDRAVVAPDDFITASDFWGFQKTVIDGDGGREFAQRQPNTRSTGCYAGRSNISIDDNGDVYPCHLFHDERFKVGNIFTDELGDIMAGARNRNFAKQMHVDHNNEFCQSCSVRYLCGGGCKANTLHATGDFHGRDALCSFLRSTIVSDLFYSYGL